MYYAISGPTIALFAMNLRRILATLFSITWLITVSVTILPVRHAWARNVVIAILFHGFIIFIHYMAECSERRLFTMRAELKVQYRAKQRAQINERKTMDAKRRFSSYIFHEVRVPLNTARKFPFFHPRFIFCKSLNLASLLAVLAVQNLKGLNVFNANSDNAIEYSALEGSLQMMSQVLNVSYLSLTLSPNRLLTTAFDIHRMSSTSLVWSEAVSRPSHVPSRFTTLCVRSSFP